MPPIYLSSTFESGNPQGFQYARTQNPTRQYLEEALASVEGARFALACSSGMSAITTVIQHLKQGDVIISDVHVYGGTYRSLQTIAANMGVRVEFIDVNDTRLLQKKLSNKNAKLLWLETPSNPLLSAIDIQEAAELSHKNGVKVVVDNTLLTAAIQRPLDHGADIVVYSTTKYINGHSDCLGGAIVLNDKQIYESLSYIQNACGTGASPFDAWLTLRGLRTLAVRMASHVENAEYLACSLADNSRIERVFHPSLFRGNALRIADVQQQRKSPLLSIELNEKYSVQVFLESLKLFTFAESLGGVESLVNHSVRMSHASVPDDIRKTMHLNENIVRLSVGIESKEDLLQDLLQALAKA